MARGHRSQYKQKRNERPKEERPFAAHKFARISDTKARIVLAQIKGKSADAALGILKYSPRYGASLIEKVLKSAIANAEHNKNMSVDDLYVEEVLADRGPSFKRMQPRARGMGYPINKKTSHITVILNKKSEKAAKRRAK